MSPAALWADRDGFEAAYFGFRNIDIFAQMKADKLPVIETEFQEGHRVQTRVMLASLRIGETSR